MRVGADRKSGLIYTLQLSNLSPIALGHRDVRKNPQLWLLGLMARGLPGRHGPVCVVGFEAWSRNQGMFSTIVNLAHR